MNRRNMLESASLALALALGGCRAPAATASAINESLQTDDAVVAAQWTSSACLFNVFVDGQYDGDLDATYVMTKPFPHVQELAQLQTTLRFRNTYPHARYFSYQSLDVDSGATLDDLRDNELQPSSNSFNPFADGASRDFDDLSYELIVRFGQPPPGGAHERNTLYMDATDHDDHETIMYRIYMMDQGHSRDELHLPLVAAFQAGVPVDPCGLVTQTTTTTGAAPAAPNAVAAAPAAVQPAAVAALGQRLAWTSGLPSNLALDGPNLDATYVTAGLTTFADPTTMVVVQYTIPSFSNTYVGDIIDDADHQVRYSSLSLFQSGITYWSLGDSLLATSANQLTTIAYATQATLSDPAVAARLTALHANVYPLDQYLAAGQKPPALLTERFLVANPSLPGPGATKQLIQTTNKAVHDAALQTVLGPNYPRAIVCNAATFGDGSCSWNAWRNLITNGGFESGNGLDAWTSWCAPNSANGSCAFARSDSHVESSYGLSLQNTTVSYPNEDGNGSAYVSQALPSPVSAGESYTISFFASSPTAGTALWYGLDLDGAPYTWLPGASCVLSGNGWQKCTASFSIPATFSGVSVRANIGVVAPSNASAVIDDVQVTAGASAPSAGAPQ